MTHAEKLAQAIAWLRSRGRYVLDLKHTTQRHHRILDDPAAAAPPPKADNVRPIRSSRRQDKAGR